MWAWTWRCCCVGSAFPVAFFSPFGGGKKVTLEGWGLAQRLLSICRFMWLWKGSRFIFLRKVTDSYAFWGLEKWGKEKGKEIYFFSLFFFFVPNFYCIRNGRRRKLVSLCRIQQIGPELSVQVYWYYNGKYVIFCLARGITFVFFNGKKKVMEFLGRKCFFFFSKWNSQMSFCLSAYLSRTGADFFKFDHFYIRSFFLLFFWWFRLEKGRVFKGSVCDHTPSKTAE